MKKTIAILLLAFTASLATGCIITSGDDATLTIDNQSDFVLVDIALRTSDGIDDYGPNVLGNSPLFPDDVITLSVDCDFYDVFIEDEDGVQCELLDLDLCFNDALWIIDNTELNICAFANQPQGPQKLEAPLEKTGRVIDLRQ